MTRATTTGRDGDRPGRVRAGFRRGAALVALVVVVAALALVVVTTLPSRGSGQPGHGPDVRTQRPERAGPSPQALRAFADRIAAGWMGRRSESGLFVDPITGGGRHGFGQVMLGQALMQAGRRRGDDAMLRAGVIAVTRSLRRSLHAGGAENPLGLLGTVSAYRWARANIRHRAVFRRAEPVWRHLLEQWSGGDVGPKAQRCFHDPTCWDNYKAIEAAGVLALAQTRLHGATAASTLSQPVARTDAVEVLERRFAQASGRAASYRTAGAKDAAGAGLGVNSDQPTYPLAYQAMTAMALASALELPKHRPGRGAVRAFARVMQTQAAIAAPDGDVAWLGRAQGQSWALAATVYAARVCTRRFARSRPALAGTCATLAGRAFGRLRARHGIGRDGLNIVPRFRTSPVDARGLDRYARMMTFNGLTAAFLDWAADVPEPARPVRPVALPLDRDGAFRDPDHARLAIARSRDLWFAVHEVGPIGVFDPRYGFGLIAAKVRRDGRWRDLLTAPPITPVGSVPADTAGPLLELGAATATPWGRSTTVSRSGRTVVVRGGFQWPDGSWAREGAMFTYRALGDGVSLTVRARGGDTLTFQDWAPAGRRRLHERGRALVLPGAVARLSIRPRAVACDGRYGSAYDRVVQSCRRTVTLPASGVVRWSIRAR
ncbi:hypothetical protein [Capillimicrobium parvum]|uniref:hypothetical protein n=1 Tax=Capillimicrobium parvum TaxID=2884022 RepID=UPI00216AB66F|nr:hypothetical protein [Capillimicrobium parvum]